jgi:hypothetical protein
MRRSRLSAVRVPENGPPAESNLSSRRSVSYFPDGTGSAAHTVGSVSLVADLVADQVANHEADVRIRTNPPIQEIS